VVLDLEPEWRSAWYGKAQSEEGVGHFRDAIASYERARQGEPGPDDGAIPLAMANCYAQLGELETALGFYDEAIRLSPSGNRIVHNRGLTLLRLRRYQAAAGDFARACELEPAAASGWIWQGYCLQHLERVEDARRCFVKAETQASAEDVAQTWMSVGAHAHERNQLGEALAAYDRAIVARPKWAVAHARRGVCLGQLVRFDEALEALDHAARLDDRLAVSALTNKATILIRQGRRKAAEVEYGRVASSQPRSAEDHASRAAALQALRRFDEALDSFASARRLDPTRIDYLYREANCLELAGHHGEAIEAFGHLLEREPDHADAWRRLADCLVASGEHERAIECSERALALGSTEHSLSFTYGVALMNLGRWQDALECFERIVATDAKVEDAWTNLAFCQVQLGQHAAVLDACDRWLEVNIKSEMAWRTRAEANKALDRTDAATSSLQTGFAFHLLEQGEINQGFAYLESAIPLDPSNWAAPRVVADLLIQAGEPERALASLAQCLEIRPHDASIWITRGALLCQLGRSDEGDACTRRAIELDPGSGRARRNYALALLESDRPAEALVQYERALEIDGENASGWYGKGLALARTSDPHGAIAAFRRAVGIDEQDVEAWWDLGTVLESLGRYHEASEARERAIALDPSRVHQLAGPGTSVVEVYARQGHASLNSGAFAAAAEAFDNALHFHPDNPELLVDRGLCAEQLEGPVRAIEYFERALELEPDHLRTHYNLGVSLMNLRRHRAAVDAFEQSITLHRSAGLEPDADRLHAHHNLGSCLMLLDLKEDALDELDEVVRLSRLAPGRWQEERRRAEALKQLLFGLG
jgi:tetratricopeptide (TPR) repeat protein